MAYEKEDPALAANQGKYWGIFICWLLGNGCLFGFNSMLTIEDYYMHLFPKYHPTRVITLTYQPFVLATTAIFTYHEAKVNTTQFGGVHSVLLELICSNHSGCWNFRKRWDRTFCWHMYHCCCFWDC